MAEGKGLELCFVDLVIKQRTDQEDKSGEQSDPVKLVQRSPYDVAGEFGGGQDGEERRRFNKGKEDDPADPDDQREKHEKSKEGHGGSSIAGRVIGNKFSPRRHGDTETSGEGIRKSENLKSKIAETLSVNQNVDFFHAPAP